MKESDTLISRLRSSSEFRRVYSLGQRFYSPYFSAFFLPTAALQARLGITVTRKIGNAVLRNRCKRRVREVFRECQPFDATLQGFDLVINPKAELARIDYAALKAAFEQTLQRFLAFKQKREASCSSDKVEGSL